MTCDVQVINNAARTWGLECLRYEIKDIVPPPGILEAMELQAEAERRKRAEVLRSEGLRQATINESEARRVCRSYASFPLRHRMRNGGFNPI
jgi:regulator of protease activity HflC (stomatin/prohibitin superfamily)